MNTKEKASPIDPKVKNKSSLPLLYKSISLLSKEEHQDLTFNDKQGFLFASANNSLPILADEFVRAEKFYPIFFSNLDEPVPLIAVGPHNENRNMFIDGDGQWMEGFYVPAYLRRYPFVLVRAKKSEQNSEAEDQHSYVLAFDGEADHFKSPDGAKLFQESGENTTLNRFVSISRDYASGGNITQAFVDALKEHDLLAWQSITRKSQSHEEETIFSFVAVNGEKINNLSDEVVVEFFRKGWLALVLYHLASLENWSRILQDNY